MVCIREMAAGRIRNMRVNRRRGAVQTQVHVRPTQPRQKHRRAKERKYQLSGS